MNKLPKKEGFEWTTEAQSAFEQLKQTVTCPPVLALLDFNETFVVKCDASGLGAGAVLMQKGKPLAYMSQPLKGKYVALSTYEREIYVVMLAVQKWRPYLMGQEFIIRIDQHSLKHLLEQRIHTLVQ